MELASIIKELLEEKWGISNPELFDSETPSAKQAKICIQDYGHNSDNEVFDRNAVCPQISINDEVEIETTPLIGVNCRVSNAITIVAYLKPMNYKPSDIGAFQTTFRNMMEEIDYILSKNRYLISGVSDLKLSGWKRVTQKQNEPIIFMAIQKVVITYYECQNCSKWLTEEECTAHGCSWNACTSLCEEP